MIIRVIINDSYDDYYKGNYDYDYKDNYNYDYKGNSKKFEVERKIFFHVYINLDWYNYDIIISLTVIYIYIYILQ